MIAGMKLNLCQCNLSFWNTQDFVNSVLVLYSSSAFSLGSGFPQQTFEKAKLNYFAETESTSVYSHLLEILVLVTNTNTSICLGSFFVWKCHYSHPENIGGISASQVVLFPFCQEYIINLMLKFCLYRLEREAHPKTLQNAIFV